MTGDLFIHNCVWVVDLSTQTMQARDARKREASDASEQEASEKLAMQASERRVSQKSVEQACDCKFLEV